MRSYTRANAAGWRWYWFRWADAWRLIPQRRCTYETRKGKTRTYYRHAQPVYDFETESALRNFADSMQPEEASR